VRPHLWQNAFAEACPQWEAAIRHAGWHQALLGLAYAIAALLCFAGAQASRRDDGTGGALAVTSVLLVLLGLHAILETNVLLVHLSRFVARQQGWYEHRRAWQYPLLALLGTAGLVALVWLRSRLDSQWRRIAPIVLGVGVLAVLAALRAVSLHYTDAALDLRLAGISVGRLAEMAGLGLTAAGAMRATRAA
jgi:hypothetical protein